MKCIVAPALLCLSLAACRPRPPWPPPGQLGEAAVFNDLPVLTNNAVADTNLISGVAITDLLARGKEYQRKRVEVRGFYHGSFENSFLCDSEATLSRAKSLWITPMHKPGHEQDIKVDWSFHGNVRIIGTFEFDPVQGVGHINGWKAQITNLELFEKTE